MMWIIEGQFTVGSVTVATTRSVTPLARRNSLSKFGPIWNAIRAIQFDLQGVFADAWIEWSVYAVGRKTDG